MEPNRRPLNLPSTLKQWRLMVFITGISNMPAECLLESLPWPYLKSNESKEEGSIILKYKLGSTIEHSWRVSGLLQANSSGLSCDSKVDVNIKKIKIHYFYSVDQNIDSFLKETEMKFALLDPLNNKLLAEGSSATLSFFKTLYDTDLCLRQTSSVLLFYNSGQYCELTIKVGLICDGLYRVPHNLSLVSLNKVHFAESSFSNSNEIPKEWM
jgi:hypothetical protein